MKWIQFLIIFICTFRMDYFHSLFDVNILVTDIASSTFCLRCQEQVCTICNLSIQGLSQQFCLPTGSSPQCFASSAAFSWCMGIQIYGYLPIDGICLHFHPPTSIRPPSQPLSSLSHLIASSISSFQTLVICLHPFQAFDLL